MTLKERVINTHLKHNFIAKYINVSDAMLSRMLNGKSKACKEKTEKLEQLLTQIESLGL